MKTIRIILVGALGLAALLAGATSAGAAKPPKLTKYTYKVAVEGVQTTSWTMNHVGGGFCDATQTGAGKETIRFSSKPTVMHSYEGLSQPYFFGKGTGTDAVGTIKLRGTANRQGKMVTEPTPECPQTGGGTTPPPDCGAKPLTGLAVVPQYAVKSDVLTLSEMSPAKATFINCHGGGATFPHLLTTDDKGKAIGQSLPYADLFEQGKNIIIARGTFKHATGDLEYTTRIRWELSLTRVKVEQV